MRNKINVSRKHLTLRIVLQSESLERLGVPNTARGFTRGKAEICLNKTTAEEDAERRNKHATRRGKLRLDARVRRARRHPSNFAFLRDCGGVGCGPRLSHFQSAISETDLTAFARSVRG